MKKLTVVYLFALLAGFLACKSKPTASGTGDKPNAAGVSAELEEWLATQEPTSWVHLNKNISPSEPKSEGGPSPIRGIVVAALSKKDPDYYFHWIRDSSHVMGAVVDVYAANRPYAPRGEFQLYARDYFNLNQRLQLVRSKMGLGEPRYTVTGEADTLPWSRPQYDGPAVRALATLKFLKHLQGKADRQSMKLWAQGFDILLRDMDYVAEVWNRRGFDIWEEYKADNYQTRLVQLSALEKVSDWLAKARLQPARVERYSSVAKRLIPLLDDHWDPARGFLRSQLAIEATDGYTAKKTDLDSAVIVSVIDADRSQGGHTVWDDRVQATVVVLEDLFRETYPLNKKADIGLGYGRYLGDVYYGGNPWYLITAYYAQFYYRLAKVLRQGQKVRISKRNLRFFAEALGLGSESEVKVETVITGNSPLGQKVIQALIARGDKILQRLQLHVPADGQLYEQFDKKTGQPVSSLGIGWSHSALIGAALERRLATEIR